MDSITDKLSKLTSWPAIQQELKHTSIVDSVTRETLSGYGNWLWCELLFLRAARANDVSQFVTDLASHPKFEQQSRVRSVARMQVRDYSFGQCVTEIRGLMGVERKTLAVVAGTNEAAIERVEKSNTVPSLHLAAEICLAFATIEESMSKEAKAKMPEPKSKAKRKKEDHCKGDDV